MTVTYTLKVSNAALCGFAKLLLRWRGSIYKLLYREMLIFIFLYYGLSCLYRYVLNPSQRTIFENITIYCEAFTDLIPLSFVLGFYVSIVVGRWWQQYMSIPWPDRVATLIGCHIYGNDVRSRMIRRTLVRYLNLMMVVTCQGISTSVKRRFPTLDHIVEAGLMTPDEKQTYEDVPSVHGRWWVPTQWFTALLSRARQEGRIRDEILYKQILDEMLAFRGCCGMLFSYDWISIPLVYTQVVTIAIYTFFLATLMGRQYLDPKLGYKGYEVDLYIPVFTILQFFFYMGWLKVAEQLINPFGEDDDDFELNWIIDRNIQLSFLMVDEMFLKHPQLVKDSFWDDCDPQLPYTKSSLSFKTEPHLGSTVDLNVNLNEATFVPMNTIAEESTCRPQRNPSTNTPFLQHKEQIFADYSPLSKRASMISLQSVRTTLQDFRNSFKGSSFDLQNIGHIQKSTHDINNTTLLNNLINSVEMGSMKKGDEDLLNISSSLQSSDNLASISAIGTTPPIYETTPLMFREANGTIPSVGLSSTILLDTVGGADHTLAHEKVWGTGIHGVANLVETLDNSSVFNNENHLIDCNNANNWNQVNHSDLMMKSETSINMEPFDNGGGGGGGESSLFHLETSLTPVMEVPECDSNQSTVSSVAELLAHTN